MSLHELNTPLPSHDASAQNVVFHQGALGDWVLVFPLLRALGGQTSVVTAGDKARLAARLIRGIEPIDVESPDMTRLHVEHGWKQISEERKRWFRSINGWIVSYISDGHDCWAENVRQLAPTARLVFVQPRPPADWNEHITRAHAVQLAAQGLRLREVALPRWDHPHGLVVIHPGSGGAAKCWPRENYERIMESLRDRGIRTQPICGEVELETWPADLRRHWEKVWNLLCLTTLGELADVISEARLFLGNDSGPTHLAAQIGVPTLALFGPTSARQWSPLGPAVVTLAPPAPLAMEWLDVPRVLASLVSMLTN